MDFEQGRTSDTRGPQISRRDVANGITAMVAVLAATRGAAQPNTADKQAGTDERYRPRIHYSPPTGFMNDPNGLIRIGADWHLYYQFNPFRPEPGNVHWGHAVSRDLVTWQTLPPAIAENAVGQAFSGSAVFDARNTSGLFDRSGGGVVAVYTRAGKIQTQEIAASHDGGITFTGYSGNPVLDVGSDQFRDPKVFWHGPTGRWVMTIVRAREHRVIFYGSPDLKRWTELGEFSHAGLLGIDYECPDMVEVPIEGGGSRWVLFVSINPGAPLGGSAVQYFVGDFDGRRFIAADAATRMVDFGKDFYAFQTFSGVDGAPVGLAWMSNWQYAHAVPSGAWRGAMTLARTLSLRRASDGWRLVQRPLGLDAAAGRTIADRQIRAVTPIPVGEALDVRLAMDMADGAVTTLRFANAQGEYLEVGLDGTNAVWSLWVDRGGTEGFRHRFFTDKMSMGVSPSTRSLDLHLILDRCSLEIFANDGEASATLLQFFRQPPDRIKLAVSNGGTLPALTVKMLQSRPGQKEPA